RSEIGGNQENQNRAPRAVEGPRLVPLAGFRSASAPRYTARPSDARSDTPDGSGRPAPPRSRGRNARESRTGRRTADSRADSRRAGAPRRRTARDGRRRSFALSLGQYSVPLGKPAVCPACHWLEEPARMPVPPLTDDCPPEAVL